MDHFKTSCANDNATFLEKCRLRWKHIIFRANCKGVSPFSQENILTPSQQNKKNTIWYRSNNLSTLEQNISQLQSLHYQSKTTAAYTQGCKRSGRGFHLTISLCNQSCYQLRIRGWASREREREGAGLNDPCQCSWPFKMSVLVPL